MPRIPQKRAAVEWLPALIYVRTERRPDFLEVEGLVCGPLTIWHDPEAPRFPSWNVGTVNTGLALTRLADEPTAKRVGELLLERVLQETLEIVSQDLLRGSLPAWVKSWCLALNKDRSWIEPDEEVV